MNATTEGGHSPHQVTECARRSVEERATWQALVRRHFKGSLKPPFNDAARAAAGMKAEEYRQLADPRRPAPPFRLGSAGS